ncbi:MAG TPA: ATP-binding protein, partial [Thermoanaerobaculia bacterium]|nr:ATP-binding protein [Thermoanaerobaculia bacterium]
YSRQQVLRPQVLDLTEVVDELGGMLRRIIGEDVRLITEHTSGRLWVRVDRSQLEQVIVNLAVNARDAMPTGGVLSVETSAVTVGEEAASVDVDLQPGSWAGLSVRDTGAGMSSEVRGRAFDPFFTTKGPGQGSGLGLSTVFGIVKQSGGAVRLESTVGSGTVARIHLPRIEEPRIEVKEIPVEASSGPLEGTVLLAEDEPAVRMLVREALVRGGFRVLEAEDGEEALAVSRGHDGVVDLLLTDVVMPNLGGKELAACLLVERPGIRVLFMSGYPNDARELGALAGSTGDLLRKPFSLKELVERARAALRSASAAPPADSSVVRG